MNNNRVKKKLLLNRRHLIASGAAGLGMMFFGGCFTKEERMQQKMDLKILSTVRDFFIENSIDPKPYLYNKRTGVAIRDSSATSLIFDTRDQSDSHWMEYNVTILNGEPVNLPLTRTAWISQEAGFVTGLWSYLPTYNLDFDGAMELANSIAAKLSLAGYEKTYTPKRQITPRTIAEYNGNYHSMWQHPLKGKEADSYFECQLEIVSSAGFSGSTLPPLAALFTSGNRENVIYMLHFEIAVSSIVDDELSRLERMRNLHISGDKTEGMPYHIWYDDPDWRPDGWDGKFV